MTTQIAGFINHGGGSRAPAADSQASDNATRDGAGRFSGLMALFDEGILDALAAGSLPTDGALPVDGQLLPSGLPPAAAAEDGPAMLESLLTPGSGFEDLASRLHALLSSNGNGLSVVAGEDAVPVRQSPGQGLPAITRELLQRLDAVLRAEQHSGQAPEAFPIRTESGGLAQALGLQQFPAAAINANALLQKSFENSAGRFHAEGLKQLIQSSSVVDGEALYTSTAPTSGQTGQQQSLSTPAFDRALPGWTLSTPLHQPQWGEEVGQRIRWMVNHQMHAAELRINPPQLGPIEVRIHLQNDQMNITFLAQHAQVRDTLEDAVPRLRELMNQQGFDDVNVDISQHQASDQQQPETDREPSHAGAGAEPGDAERVPADRVELWSGTAGNIDFYA